MQQKIKKIKEPIVENAVIKWSDNLGFYLLVFIIFIIPLYFNIKAYDQFELPKLTLLRILTSILFGIWAIRELEKGTISFVKTPLDIPLLLWIAINIVCTIFSIAPHLSFRGEYENFAGSLSNINYVILYFLAVQFLKNTKQIQILLIALMISGFLICLYSVAQFFGYDFIKWNEESVIKGRYFASMGNPNFLGALLIMIIPVVISYFVMAIKNRKNSLIFVLFAFFILLYIALFGTQSRGPFLGFVFSFLFMLSYGIYKLYKNLLRSSELQHVSFNSLLFALIKKYRIWIILFFVLMGIAIFLSLTIGKNATKRITESIADIKGSLSQSRLHIWIPALKIIKDYPILGTGVDTFKAIFPKYEGLDFAYIDGTNVSSRTAHNELLNIAATMGLIGLAIYLLIIFVFIKLFYKPFAAINNFEIKLISLSLFASFIAYFVQNIFSFGVAAINTTLYLFMAIQAFIYNSIYGEKKLNFALYPSSEKSTKFIFQIIAVIISSFFAYKAYILLSADYSYNKGKILGNVYGRWDLAIKEHIKSVEKVPLEVKYHVYLGLAYEQMALRVDDRAKQIDLINLAIKEYKKGIELNPANSYYWGNLGRIYSLFARIENNPEYYQQSIYYYTEAIKKAPVTGLFYHNLIELYVRNNMINEALQVFSKLEFCDKKLAANAAFLLGNVFFTGKDFARAIEFYQKAVTYVPDFLQAQFNLAVTYATLNDKNTALTLLQDILIKKPDFDKADEINKMIKQLKR